jgi:DNA-binding response OmpR family regulator
MTRILIVEDEIHMLELLSLELTHENYMVDTAITGKEALEKMLQDNYDLVLLDLMLPLMNGIEVCRRLRLEKDTPVIMLTARDSVMDKVKGLVSGADDYLAKPFEMEELLARIRAVLRRQHQEIQNIIYRDLTLNYDTFQVKKREQEIELTVKEFMILKLFIKHPGKVISRDTLIKEVWGMDFDPSTNVVDVYIKHLRNKLETQDDQYIYTIRGIGYCFK